LAGKLSSHLPSKLEKEEARAAVRWPQAAAWCLAPASVLRRCGAAWDSVGSEFAWRRSRSEEEKPGVVGPIRN
jgi:hypothetical protein